MDHQYAQTQVWSCQVELPKKRWSFTMPSYLPWNSSRVLVPSASFPLLSVKCASIVQYVASSLLMMSISMFPPFLISCVSLESDRSTWISLACFRHCAMVAVKSFCKVFQVSSKNPCQSFCEYCYLETGSLPRAVFFLADLPFWLSSTFEYYFRSKNYNKMYRQMAIKSTGTKINGR